MADGEFNARKVSPSRIGTYADCGHAFKLRYIDRVQPERNGTAALFGSVMHRARERWVVNRDLDMIQLTREAWLDITKDEPVVASFLQRYQALSGKAIRQEEAIRRAWAKRGKESRAPRMTKEWKESEIARQISGLMREWLPKLESSKYDFSENDPLPKLYDESLVLAWKYGEKWKHLPNAFVGELAYDFEWHGFQLIGFIDDISPLVTPEGELLGHAIIDAKTYATDKHSFKDWRQLQIYTLAYRHLADNGLLPFEPHEKLYGCVDKMRLLERTFYEFDERTERQLLRELETYERAVENHIFIPASKTCSTKYCDFAGACEYYHGAAGRPVELNVA